MKTDDTYISLKNVSLILKNQLILKNITFSFSKNKIYGILGKNGSGKTSLIKTIAGLNYPNYQGEICLLYKKNADKKIFAAFLFQHLERVTNFKAIQFLKLQTSESYSSYDGFLKTFSLEHKINAEISDLSGGEWRKIQISSVLSKKSSLLVLDEPDLELDIFSQKKLISLIKKYVQENSATVLFTSHNLSFAISLADEILLMSQGQVVCSCESHIKNANYLQNKLLL